MHQVTSREHLDTFFCDYRSSFNSYEQLSPSSWHSASTFGPAPSKIAFETPYKLEIHYVLIIL